MRVFRLLFHQVAFLTAYRQNSDPIAYHKRAQPTGLREVVSLRSRMYSVEYLRSQTKFLSLVGLYDLGTSRMGAIHFQHCGGLVCHGANSDSVVHYKLLISR